MAQHVIKVDLDMDGNKITNLDTPSVGGDATNKTYVDGAIAAADITAGAGLTESPAGTFNVANTDTNLTITANSVDFSAGAAAVVTAGPAPALAAVAPPVIPTSGTSNVGVAVTAARGDHTHGIALATTSLQGAMSATDKSRSDNWFNNGWYNVLDNGISTANSGATNLTAMNALLTAATANSTIYFPPSSTAYDFSGVITVPAKAFRFMGGGQTKTIIRITSGTGNIFAVGANFTDFVGLRFGTTTTRTSGAAIAAGSFTNVNIYNCYFDSQFHGITYSSGVDCGVFDCYFSETDGKAIEVQGASSSVQVHNCIGTCTAGVTNTYFDVIECASFVMSNCRWKNGSVNAQLNPNSGTKAVRNVSISNTTFETATNESVKFLAGASGVTITNVQFVNCKFISSSTGVEIGAATATLLPTGVLFSNCSFLGNTNRGIYAVAAQDFNVSNCLFAGNGSSGIQVSAAASSATKFLIQNCTIGPGGGFGANAVGIQVDAGTYGSYTIMGNNVAGNTSNNNINDLGTVATTDLKRVINNTGHIVQTIATNRGAVTSGTGETVLFSARIPARAVIAGQAFRYTLYGRSSSTGTLQFRARAGTLGTTFDGQIDIPPISAAQAANAMASLQGTVYVIAAGGSGSVTGGGWAEANGVFLARAPIAELTQSVDTTVPWFISLSCACSSGTFTVDHAVVEAI